MVNRGILVDRLNQQNRLRQKLVEYQQRGYSVSELYLISEGQGIYDRLRFK